MNLFKVQSSKFKVQGSQPPSPFRAAFTLIELMIVIGIMAVIVAMGIPMVYSALHKGGLNKAVNDVVEVLGTARRLAILQGTMTEVVFHPKNLSMEVAGGGKMLRTATEAAKKINPHLVVLAVTVLTSLNDEDLGTLGVRGVVADHVLRLAALALANGCQGIVASAQECEALREEFGHDFVIVTPGVRPAGSGHDDQARVVTPSEAIAAGASYIVVGRPITEAIDPAAEARAILGQLAA